MNNNGRPRIDYTNRDYASLRAAMLELAREKLPAWTDHSANDLGVVLLELFAYMGDILLYYQDRIANESYLETAVERRSVINLLRLIGYELRPPEPASADLTLLFEEEAEGMVTIPTGAKFQTTTQANGQPIHFQYLGKPLDIPLGPITATEDDKHPGKLYKHYKKLPVVQVDATEPKKPIGSSDGSAAQRFALARTPLITRSLEVLVDEGAGPKAWTLRETLLHSLSIDEHFTIHRDKNDVAWIEFGDGKHGKIPKRGRNNISASYRVGGGEKGNVPSYTIIKAVPSIDSLKRVFNEQPATGGAEAEPLSEAVLRGPKRFRAMGRAVTAQDYEAYAMKFGVGKVRARAASWNQPGGGEDAGGPGVEVGKVRARAAGWNRVELIVAPVGGGYPTDTLKQDLRAYFEDKRMLSCVVEVLDPNYVDVYIEGNLEVEPYFFTEQVQQRVENAVRELLAFERVAFGDRLYLSKVYEAIEAIEGVAGVTITNFARGKPAEGSLPSCPDGVLCFGWNEIPKAAYNTGIKLLDVKGGFRAR